MMALVNTAVNSAQAVAHTKAKSTRRMVDMGASGVATHSVAMAAASRTESTAIQGLR